MGRLSQAIVSLSLMMVLYCCLFAEQPIIDRRQQTEKLTSTVNTVLRSKRRYGPNPYFFTHSDQVTDSPPSPQIGQRALAGDDHGDDDHGDDDHGEDDHGDDHDGHVPLFGAMAHIDSQRLVLSVLIVVGVVLSVEYSFWFLHIFTKDSPFNSLIIAIEKELMVVGSTAFALKIFINVSDILTPEWFFALEFADLLVPMFAFANCMLGITLIILSIRQVETWSRAYHLKTDEILDEFYDATNAWYFHLLWSPLNHGITQVEFRILHDIFCDLYKIQRHAFAFDQYAQRVYEKFVHSIIDIRLVNWALLIVLMLLNMIRTEHGHTIYDCDEYDISCIDKASARVFAYTGAVMFGITCIFVFVSRHYEVLIIRKRGIQSVKDYPDFLHYVDSLPEMATSTTRMDEQDLKRVMQEFRDGQLQHNNSVMHALSDLSYAVGSSSKWMSRSSKKYSPAEQTEKALLEMEAAGIKTKLGRSFKVKKDDTSGSDGKHDESSSLDDDGLNEFLQAANQALSPSTVDANSNLQRNSFAAVAPEPVHPNQNMSSSAPYGDAVESFDVETGGGIAVQSSHMTDDCMLQEKVNFRETIVASDHKGAMPTSNKPHGHYMHQKHDYVRNIFLFDRPELYFEAVQLMIMLVAVYLALWLVNFSSSHIPPLYKFLTFLPALLSALNYVFIVKSAALLKAVYEVDKEAVLEVLEQTEGSRILGDTIRAKLLERLNLSDPYEQLKVLFTEIDNDKNSALSRFEFEVLMSKLKISFSRKKWKQIYREIDRNYDDYVSFEEFFLFLFPTHSDALSLEHHRLRIIKNRVAMKSLRAAASENNSWFTSFLGNSKNSKIQPAY